MLIRFGCSNYKSFSEYQELLLTASRLKDDQSDLVCSESFNEPLLSSVAIYGANASGKSNMLLALREMIGFVRTSHRGADTEGIHRDVFKLDETFQNKVTEFDLDFICHDTHYHYGFKFDDECVVEEWLYSYSYVGRKSRKILFHRNVEDKEPFYFGKTLKGENKVIKELVRPNSLFLSAAAQNNHATLKGIYAYLNTHFRFRFDKEINEHSIADGLENSDDVVQILGFLEKLDVGIKNIEIHRRKIDDEQREFMELIRSVIDEKLRANYSANEILKPIVPTEISGLDLFHESVSGVLIKFSLEEESLGTRTVIALLVPVVQVLRNGGILVVDELESSLHALLTLKILSLFSNKTTNRNGAQLVFSTHETNVLCGDLLRRDQIWFSEKSSAGNTILTPLTDFKLRKDFDIQSGYLEGRFGAIPFYGNLNQLFNTNESLND